MFRSALALCLLASLLAGCASVNRDASAAAQPVATWVTKKIEGTEEEPVGKYYVVFRNVSNEVVSFDYTMADRPDVPHIDSEGPHSGLIENLYPGIEKELENPYASRRVWVTIGTITSGKRTSAELATLYRLPSPEIGLAPDESL